MHRVFAWRNAGKIDLAITILVAPFAAGTVILPCKQFKISRHY